MNGLERTGDRAMTKNTIRIFFIIGMLLIFSTSGSVFAGDMKHEGHGMSMHHQHIMLNHALGMVLEGSNLVMLGQMGMAKGVDEVSINHGRMMMKNGRSLYNEIMTGDTMMKMHGAGTSPKDHPAMTYTHELASAQLKVMDLLSKMTGAERGGHDMVMHHQHIMLNHALGMALEGSNLVMLGQMNMAKGVDEVSIKHGRMMMKNGKSVHSEIMTSDAMMKMHGAGTSPKDHPGMTYTHRVASTHLKVMDLLKKMDVAGGN
jgi:hypothetical protein